MCNDGIMDAQLSRIIKSLQITTLIVNTFGFSLLIIKAYFFPNNSQFLSILNQTFTFLILTEILLTISTKYWVIKSRIINSPQSPSTPSLILNRIIESFKNGWDILHFILIFLQPNIFHSPEINEHMYNLAPIRLYSLIRFGLKTQFLLNPRFQRICDLFHKSKPLLALKIAYKKYFLISILSVITVLVIGFGNLMKDQEISVFQDIYVASYFIFITISTVGYGDYVPLHILPRVITVVILIAGVFIMSVLTLVFLKQSRLSNQESITYFQMKELDVKELGMGFIRDRMVELIDQSMRREEERREEDNLIYINETNNVFSKEEGRFEHPISSQSDRVKETRGEVEREEQESTRRDEIEWELRQLNEEMEYLSMTDPIKILMAKHRLQRIKKKIIPLSLTTSQFLEITKNKQYNIPGHRSFYTQLL